MLVYDMPMYCKNKEKVEKGELPKEALEDPYKMFQVILSALIRTMTLRPKLNRFIAHNKLYQRNDLILGFVVKKKFADNGGEALAFLKFNKEDNMNTVHEKIVKEINTCRKNDNVDHSTDMMDKFIKMPPFLLRPIFALIRAFDRRGWMPYSLIFTLMLLKSEWFLTRT